MSRSKVVLLMAFLGKEVMILSATNSGVTISESDKRLNFFIALLALAIGAIVESFANELMF